MQLTKGQASDYQGAVLLMDAMDALPEARALLADRADDAGWFRDALRTRGMRPCIPPGRGRKRACPYDQDLYNSPLKKSQQCTMRVKIFVRQSHNSLILRYLKVEIPVAWNLKYGFSTACYIPLGERTWAGP